MSRRLVLVRHGRTAWNHVGRAQGQSDVELDATGHAQARDAARVLAGRAPAVLWTSDLVRARQSAAYLEEATGLVAKVDDRLREYDLGVREGLTGAEFETQHPDAYARWRADGATGGAAGGEDHAAVAARIVPALGDVLASLDDGETAVAYSHGAALKMAVVGLLGWPEGCVTTLDVLDNCAWATLVEDAGRGLRLAAYNQGAPDFAS